MNILSMADRALVAYIASQGPKAGFANGTLPGGPANNIFPAKREDKKVIPCTVAWSHTFRPCESARFAGNFDVQSFIEVRTKGLGDGGFTNPREISDERIIATFTPFLSADGDTSGEQIGALITAAARKKAVDSEGSDTAFADLKEFTVQSCEIIEGNQGFNPRVKEQRGNVWIEVLHLEMVCCPANVS
jgi:hypothetical protein